MLIPRSTFRGFRTDVGVMKNGAVWIPLKPVREDARNCMTEAIKMRDMRSWSGLQNEL